jgi:tetratricopeptide (TPR) repeat protein
MPNIEWNQKGDYFLAINDFEQAIKCYDIAVKLDPNDFEAYNEKGNAYLGLSEFRSAAEAFIKAYEMNSSFIHLLIREQLCLKVNNMKKHWFIMIK